MMAQSTQLRQLYEDNGVIFRDGQAVLDLGAQNTMSIDENLLINPDPKNMKNLVDSINASFSNTIEIFDPADTQHEFRDKKTRRRNFGRIFHHFEIQGFPPKKVNYYTYLTMSANTEDVSDESWEKMALYLVCVVATMTLLVVLGIISSGTSVYASIALFGAVAAACIAAMEAVTKDEQKSARITKRVGK